MKKGTYVFLLESHSVAFVHLKDNDSHSKLNWNSHCAWNLDMKCIQGTIFPGLFKNIANENSR